MFDNILTKERRDFFVKRVVAVLIVLILVLEVFVDRGMARAAYEPEDFYGFTEEKIMYIRTTRDVEVYRTAEDQFGGWTDAYVPKGTVIGQVIYKLGAYNHPAKVDGKYLHGFKYFFEMKPKHYTAKKYYHNTLLGKKVCRGTVQVYSASEYLKVSANIPKLGTYPNSAYSAQYDMCGGGTIYEYAPMRTTIGEDGYSIGISIPKSVSGEIDLINDFCAVKDTTDLLSRSWCIAYDYIKSAGGFAGGDRKDVIYKSSYQAASLFWTTKDNNYRVRTVLTAKFALTRSQTRPSVLYTGQSTCYPYFDTAEFK